ncbi:MAG: VWA domain-containing protein [Caldilineaceae bacterium]|nr:VWA domain-containing protein [Caldilineaceae bacterium]MDE0336857.1 VWA domain-containing protein [Caldilineaceae bacterium]
MSGTQDGKEQEQAVPSEAKLSRFPSRRQFFAFAVVGCFLLCACGMTTVRAGAWIAGILSGESSATSEFKRAAAYPWPSNSASLTVAVSPSVAESLRERAGKFNGLRLRTPDGEMMQVEMVTRSSPEIVAESLQQPGFQAVVPDSSLWLELIEVRWAGLFPTDSGILPARRVGQTALFAVSPIVIAVQLNAAQQLGWPHQSIGWQEVHTRAAAPSTNFRWGHPSPESISGIAATLSKFHAGADITRGLTTEIATRADVVDYVRQAERAATVLGANGRSHAEPMQRDRGVNGEEGKVRGPLDAFVTQEQAVIAWNRSSDRGLSWLSGEGKAGPVFPNGQLVAIYPKEGTLWADYPFALLELDGRAGPAVTRNQRSTYRAFTRFLLSEDSQYALLEAGFRPVDLTIDLMAEPSPFAETGTVDPLSPQTLLTLPPQPVLEIVMDAWRLSMPPVNVMLVVDTSDSMKGSKLSGAKIALQGFVDQMQGDGDRIGLVEFGSGVKQFGSLQRLDAEGRGHVLHMIESMQAGGSTQLIDALWAAQSELTDLVDSEATYAIVVLTDGRDNDSEYRLRDLQRAIQGGQNSVFVHTVAFGRDADAGLLEDLARVGNGRFYRADETTIEEIYRQIATSIQMTE